MMTVLYKSYKTMLINVVDLEKQRRKDGRLRFAYFSWRASFLGSGPNREPSPVEWSIRPYIRLYIHPSVHLSIYPFPPLGLLAGPQAPLVGPHAPLGGPQPL